MKRKTILLALGLTVLVQLNSYAEDFNINAWTPDHVAMIPSKNSDGSAILLTPDNPHSGKQCPKLVYNLHDGAYAEYNLNTKMVRPALMAKGGPLKVTFWVRGNPAAKVTSMNIRLIDATGEVFQYPLKGIATAMQSADWVKYSTDIDLNNPVVHFSGNNDGVLDYPVKLLSLALDAREADSGSIYIDDLQWEQAPAAAN